MSDTIFFGALLPFALLLGSAGDATIHGTRHQLADHIPQLSGWTPLSADIYVVDATDRTGEWHFGKVLEIVEWLHS